MTTSLRVGITGGIGSGKTTACRMFQVLGIPVYDADFWAKWLIERDAGLRTQVTAVLGPEAYLPDGAYNRAYVARRVFADAALLAALNAVVHPVVEQHSRRWHDEQAARGYPYTLKEAALLIESGSHRFLDALIVVTAPEEVRIRRVMERDGLGEDAVRARMLHQMPEAEKAALADFVLVNDGQRPLIPQVWRTHRALLARRQQVK
jgi:dephospho-CoA kinase